MERLPEREQNLLLLRYWIGLSHQEVAQALDLPEGTVRRQVRRTHRQTAGMLERRMKREAPTEREMADLFATAFERLAEPDARRLAAIEQRLLERPRRRVGSRLVVAVRGAGDGRGQRAVVGGGL